MVRSGNYRIVNCQDNIDVIPILLHNLWEALIPVLQDAGLNQSSSAYTTFFKDISYSSYVSAVLTNVSTGVALTAQGGPAFICVNAPNQFSYTDSETMKKVDTYQQCRDNPKKAIFWISNNPYIIVCPRFFDPGFQSLPPPNTCQQVSRNGEQFSGAATALIQSRIWFILHEIVHYYIYTTRQSTLEVYDINACLRLSGQDAIGNAESYAYYAACEFIASWPIDGWQTYEYDCSYLRWLYKLSNASKKDHFR